MSITSNPIVRIKDFQTYQGVEILNVYNYVLDSIVDPLDLNALATQFLSTVVTPIRATQNPNLVHDRMVVEQVNRGVQFEEISHSLAGTKAGGNDAPTFVNASYKLARTDKDTRDGRKSITGLDETDFTGNNLTAGAIAVHATALVGVVTNLTTGDGIWIPIILGQPTGTADQYKYNIINGGGSLVRPELTTQNTRKD